MGVLGNNLAVFGGEPILKTRQSEVYDAELNTWNFTDVYLNDMGRDNAALITIPCDFNELVGCEWCPKDLPTSPINNNNDNYNNNNDNYNNNNNDNYNNNYRQTPSWQ